MSDALLLVLVKAFALTTLVLTLACTGLVWACRRIRQVQEIDREQLRDAWRVIDAAHLRHELKRPHGGWPR